MKILPISFLILFSIVFASCGLKPVVPTAVTDVQFGKIDFFRGTVVMNMGLQIDNPNNFAITVHGLELAVKVDSMSMGTVSVEDKIRIEKDTQMIYRVNVHAKLTDIINGIPVILSAISSKTSNAELNGWIQVGAFGLKRKFPVALAQKDVQTGQQ